MKKIIPLFVILTLSLLTLSGCGTSEKDNKFATQFKEEYESINGKTNSRNVEYRTVKIDENNVFQKITEEKLVEKLNNKESFYIYFGSELCPWCRSVIEVADKISRENGIDIIYYLDIWDDKGNEIFRDKYTVTSNGDLELVSKGTEGYKLVLERFDEYLSDYILTDSNCSKIDVGEKRVYAPNFAYVLNGKAIRLVTGISNNQKDSHEILTEEMIKEEEEIFKNFFTNSCSTDSRC